jgi:hypothetical protein
VNTFSAIESTTKKIPTVSFSYQDTTKTLQGGTEIFSAAVHNFASKPRLAPFELLASLPSKPNCLLDDFAFAKPLRCKIKHYSAEYANKSSQK